MFLNIKNPKQATQIFKLFWYLKNSCPTPRQHSPQMSNFNKNQGMYFLEVTHNFIFDAWTSTMATPYLKPFKPKTSFRNIILLPKKTEHVKQIF